MAVLLMRRIYTSKLQFTTQPGMLGQNNYNNINREGRFNVFQLLIEYGADIIIEDKFGQSCIFYAIREGHYDIIEFLVKLSDNKLDKPDKKGVTPFMFALKNGKTKISELLRESGFSTEAPSHDKKSKSKKPKATAAESVKTEEESKLKKFVLVKINESGDKIPLSPKEIEEFEKEYPDIFELLKNPAALEKLEKEAPDE
jgi:ankyrin repeat protein